MPRAVYITHPQVDIDPNVPVPQWDLSQMGRTRAHALAARNLFPDTAFFVASAETKAITLSRILANGDNTKLAVDEDLGENDRTATGFLPAAAFEKMADRFFAEPDESADGWETARDAQIRIVAAVTRIQAHYPGCLLVFCGHGAVGTLLKCHVSGRPIARTEDQPDGGGNYFVFDLAPRTLICDWTPIETYEGI